MRIAIYLLSGCFVLAAFSLLCLLKQGSSFASVYARGRLGVSSSEASNLYTTYNLASACAGLLGGVLYDVVPHGKAGLGVLSALPETREATTREATTPLARAPTACRP